MLRRTAERFSAWTQQNVPDPFVLALWLTALVVAGGAANMVARGDDALTSALALSWFRGFTRADGFAFAFQMATILVTGHVLAVSPPVRRLLGAIAGLPRSPGGAAALVAFATCLLSLVHWGLGAVGGALLAREVGRRARAAGRVVHYPLLGAAAYVGFAVWHGGLSGSVPLKVAEQGHSLVDSLGVLPLSATLFGVQNLVITGFMVVAIPLLAWHLSPAPAACQAAPELANDETPASAPGGMRRYATIALGVVPAAAIVAALARGKVPFDLNTVNFLFLFTGIALHANIDRFLAAVSEASSGAGAILVQFPFYFAIATVMQDTGLLALLSETITATATRAVFPAIAFTAAAIINFAVPSGGGLWVVQGPLLATSGAHLGVDPALTVMSFAYGEASTNLLQPFWALPLLAIMKLRVGDIFGYTAIICAFHMVGCVVFLLLFG
jgi:short-chain fatty acids transporter